MSFKIVVVLEHQNGHVKSSSYEALECAVQLNHVVGGEILCLVVGDQIEPQARSVNLQTDHNVLAVNCPGLDFHSSEAYKEILSPLLQTIHADWICIPGTTLGMEVGTGLAAVLDACCLRNVVTITKKDAGVAFSRKLFNGKFTAQFVSYSEITIIVPELGAFQPNRQGPPGSTHSCACSQSRSQASDGAQNRSYQTAETTGRSEAVNVITVNKPVGKIRLLGHKDKEKTDSVLCEAEVVVAAGRGIGKIENLNLIKQITALFRNASYAGSRPLCDSGWLPYKTQVGQTGAVISPALYFACGISGAQQHIVGMKGSKFVVAVNTDPNAAIFNESDICIVENCTEFLRELLNQTTMD